MATKYDEYAANIIKNKKNTSKEEEKAQMYAREAEQRGYVNPNDYTTTAYSMIRNEVDRLRAIRNRNIGGNLRNIGNNYADRIGTISWNDGKATVTPTGYNPAKNNLTRKLATDTVNQLDKQIKNELNIINKQGRAEDSPEVQNAQKTLADLMNRRSNAQKTLAQTTAPTFVGKNETGQHMEYSPEVNEYIKKLQDVNAGAAKRLTEKGVTRLPGGMKVEGQIPKVVSKAYGEYQHMINTPESENSADYVDWLKEGRDIGLYTTQELNAMMGDVGNKTVADDYAKMSDEEKSSWLNLKNQDSISWQEAMKRMAENPEGGDAAALEALRKYYHDELASRYYNDEEFWEDEREAARNRLAGMTGNWLKYTPEGERMPVNIMGRKGNYDSPEQMARMDEMLYDSVMGEGAYQREIDSYEGSEFSDAHMRELNERISRAWDYYEQANPYMEGSRDELFDILTGRDAEHDAERVETLGSERRHLNDKIKEIDDKLNYYGKVKDYKAGYQDYTAENSTADDASFDKGKYNPNDYRFTLAEKGSNNVDDIYSFIIGGNERQSYVEATANGWKETPPNVSKDYKGAMLLMPDEINIFKNLYEAGKKDEAMAFLDGLQFAINSRYIPFEEVQTREEARAFPILSSIFVQGANVVNTALGVMTMADAALTKAGVDFGPNDAAKDYASNAYATVRYAQATQDEIANMLGPEGGKLYLQSMNSIRNVINGVLMYKLGIPEGMLPTATLATFGTQIYQEQMYNYLKESYDFDKANALATLDTALEIGEELLPIETMFATAGSSLFVRIISNMLSEMGEEFAGATAGTVLKGIITGRNEWSKREDQIYNEGGYVDDNGNWVKVGRGKQGLAQAEEQAMREWGKEIVENTVAGGFGGAFGATYGAITSSHQLSKAGKGVRSRQNIVGTQTGADQLIKAAQGMAEGTESRKIADNIAKKVGKGGKASNYQLGKLVYTMAQESNENIADIAQGTLERSAREQLASEGVDQATIDKVAPIVAKAAARGTNSLSIKERLNLATSRNAIDLLKSFIADDGTLKEVQAAMNEGNGGKVAMNVQQTVRELMSGHAKIMKGGFAARDVEEARNRAVVAEEDDIQNAEGKMRNNGLDVIVDNVVGQIVGRKGDQYTVRFEDGHEENVTAKKILAATSGLATLIEYSDSGNSHINDDAFNTILAGIEQNPDMDGGNYVSEAVNAYIRYRMLGNVENSNLNPETLKQIQAEAQKANRQEREKAAKKGESQAAVTPGKGTLTYDGIQYGEQGWRQKVKELGAEKAEQASALGQMVTMMGNRVRLINDENNPGLFGWEDETGEIVINLAAKDMAGTSYAHDRSLLTIAAHELTHWLEQNSREGYEQLRQFVFDQLRKQGGENAVEDLVLQTMEDYRRAAENNSKVQAVDLEGAMAEVVANACDNILSNRKVAEALQAENPDLYKSVKGFVRDFVARMRSASRNMSSTRESRMLAKAGQEVADKLADMWLGARSEAINRERTQGETQVQNTGIQNSIQQLENGEYYVNVDTDQEQFAGKKPKEILKMARKVIREKYLDPENLNNVFDLPDGKVKIDADTADEYSYSSKRKMKEAAKRAKGKAAPEIDNLIKISRRVLPGDPLYPNPSVGHDLEQKNVSSMKYYSTLFKVGGRFFTGILNVEVKKNGQRLKDITQIKEDTSRSALKDMMSGSPTDQRSDIAASANEEILQQNSIGVKKFSVQQEPTEPGQLTPEDSVHPESGQFSVTQMAEATRLGVIPGDQSLTLYMVDPNGKEIAALNKKPENKGKKWVKVDGVKVKITPEMVRDTPVGMLIDMGLSDEIVNKNGMTQKESARAMFAEMMNMCARYRDNNLIWEIAGSEFAETFSALKNNSDPQYRNTVDFGTICSKTQAIVDVLSNTMKKRIADTEAWNKAHPNNQRIFSGLTRQDIMMVYNQTHNAKLSVPCPVCYVFSRWMGVPSLLGQMNRFQHIYVETVKDANGQTVYDKNGDAVIDWEKTSEKANRYIKEALQKYGSKEAITDAKQKLQKKIEKRDEKRPELQKKVAALKKESQKPGLTLKQQKAYEERIRKAEAAVVKNDQDADRFTKELEEVEAYNWVTQALCVQHNEGNKQVNDTDENGNYIVDKTFRLTPEEILFDLNRTGEFAGYTKNWRYRTTRGAGMGKAIMPYSGASIGDLVHGDSSRWSYSQNPFLIMDEKAARKAFENAKERVRKQNLVGGQRFQSTSDFRPEWGLDYMMSFLEMQALGSKVQMYTKVREAVDFLGSIGADLNESIMASGNGWHIATAEEIQQAKTDKELASRMGETYDKDGVKHTYVMDFSDVTGMDYNEAKANSKKYNSVQMILVGMNDVHIRLALANDDIDFVIPWHSSGNSKDVLQQLVRSVDETLTESDDYTKFQEDAKKKNRTAKQEALWNARVKLLQNGAKSLTDAEIKTLQSNPFTKELYRRFAIKGVDDDCYGVTLPKDQAEKIFPYEYWDKTSTRENADVNGRRFVEYCEAMGLTPRFAMFKNEKGYWKLLIDRKMFDNNVLNPDGSVKTWGKYREQQVVDVTKAEIGQLPTTATAKYGDNYKEETIRAIENSTAALRRKYDVEPSNNPYVEENQAEEQPAKQMSVEQMGLAELEQAYEDAYNNYDDEEGERIVAELAERAFPDSKVRDENGKLKVVYHQTNAVDEEGNPFTVFDMTRARQASDIVGAFFAPKFDEYHEYGDRTYAVYLNITNPKYDVFDVDSSKMDGGLRKRNELIEQGYDGVINTEDGEIIEYVAFYPEQIKSAEPFTEDDDGNLIPLIQRMNKWEPDVRFSVDQNDMDVRVWMQGLTDGSVSTAQEKAMLKQYQTLAKNLEIERGLLFKRRQALRELQKNQNPSVFDRKKIRDAEATIEAKQKQLNAKERKLMDMTSEKGFARLMYDQAKIMNDLVNGRTVEEVQQTVDDMSGELDMITKQMAEREKEIADLKQKAMAAVNALENVPGAEAAANQLKVIVSQMGLNEKNLQRAKTRIGEIADNAKVAGVRTGNIQKAVNAAIAYNNKLTEQSEAATWQEERRKLVNTLRSEHTQAMLRQQSAFKLKLQKDKQIQQAIRENTNMARKIDLNVNRVRQMMAHENTKVFAPERIKPIAREMLRRIVVNEATGKWKLTGFDSKQLAEIDRLLKAWEVQDGKYSPDNLQGLDEGLADAMVNALEQLQAGLDFLNAGERNSDRLVNIQAQKNALTRVYEAVTTITGAIYAERNLVLDNRKEGIERMAYRVQEGTNGRQKKERTGKLGMALNEIHKAVISGNLTPEYFFKMLKNGGLSQLWEEYHRQENRNGLLLQKAKDDLAEIADKYGYKDWDTDKTVTVTLKSGDVQMTLGQLMALYATWKRENTLGPQMSEHLKMGGFYVEQGDPRKGILGSRTLNLRAHRVNDEDMEGVKNLLTQEQKDFVDDVVSYMSNEMSDIGNEASMKAYGIKMYKEKYYYPFKIWDGVKSKASNDAGKAAGKVDAVFHPSFSKGRLHGANNAVILGDFLQTAADHIVGMINYATIGVANENMQKVLNAQVPEGDRLDNMTKRSIRAVLQEAYGREAMDYMEKVQEQMNGGVQRVERSLYDRALTLFRKNAVAGSLSVTLQQPLSYIRAAMLINPKYLAQAISPQYWKGSFKEMMDHSGVAVIKKMGRFDMGFGAGAREYITPEGKEGKIRKAWDTVTDKSTILPELFDQMTWTRMWTAVKMEQHDLHPNMDMKSDEFLDMCGTRFNEVMRRTQVYDSVLTKSQNMRSQNPFVKSITSFMAEPTLTLNVLADAMQNIGQKGGKMMAVKALATFAMSAAAQAAFKALMSSGRTPDEKKTWWENWLYRFYANLLNEGDVLNLVPGYNDLITLLKSGKLEDDALGMAGKISKAFEMTTRQFNIADYRSWEDGPGQIVQLFTQLPAKNIMRDLRAMYNWFIGKPYADRETSDAVLKYQMKESTMTADNLLGVIVARLGEAGYKTTNKGYYGRLFDAMQNDNQQEAEGIREYLQLAKGVEEDAIASGLRTQARERLETAEADQWMIDNDLLNSTSTLTTQYKEGKITAEEYTKLAKAADPDLTDNDIWWKIDRMNYSKETGEDTPGGKEYYYRLTDAVNANNGEEIRKTVKELLAHGITKDRIKDKLNDWKKAYLAADSAGKIKIRDALQKAYQAAGYTTKDADKTIENWKKDAKKNK